MNSRLVKFIAHMEGKINWLGRQIRRREKELNRCRGRLAAAKARARRDLPHRTGGPHGF